MATDYINPVSPLAGGDSAPVTNRFSWSDAFQKHSYFALLGITALLVYSFWNMLQSTSAFWQSDQYSHGYLIPFIALYLAWSMRPNPAAHEPGEGEAEETFLGIVPASMIRWASIASSLVALACYWYLSLPTVAGVMLAVGCVLGFAYVLIGQPFQPVSAGERWIGLAILLAAYALRIFVGANLYMEPASRAAFIVALLGGFLLIGGGALLRWTGAAVGFLIFMYPLPTAIEGKLLLNLQKLAALMSEVVLTILNQPVVRVGNKIIVDDIPLEVAEACSGLRMITIFGGFAVACALLIKRPWWDRLIILLSAIPIALIVNITRIVVTALLYRLFPEGEAVHQLIHDYAGLAMMPLAMGLLYLELKILATLSVEEEGIDIGHGGAPGAFTPGATT
ncbi:MAG: exosortase/archaeosortase family protein [Planctomycetota bacterium]